MRAEMHNPFSEQKQLDEKALFADVQTADGARQVLSKIETLSLDEMRKAYLRTYAEIVIQQEEMKSQETDVNLDDYSMHLLPGLENTLPQEFINHAYEFALQNGKKLKHVSVSDKGEPVNEIVWQFPGKNGRDFVIKLIQPDKTVDPEFELRILQRAEMLDLPSPKPLGIMHVGSDDFVMMEFVRGRSGQDIWDKLEGEQWSAEEISQAQEAVDKRMKTLAELFRSRMFIDKPWYIKDSLLTMQDHRITEVFPLDWERAHPYDPAKPDKIRTVPPIRKAA